MNSTTIIRSILEVLGDPQLNGGYSLSVNDAEVPVFLNKDSTTVYPEVILSPFIIREKYETHNNYGKILRDYTEYEKGICQIDIFAKTLIECDDILAEIKKRIYDFGNLEVLHHRACIKDLTKMDNNIYKSYAYACESNVLKDIYHIEVNGTPLTRVLSVEKLENNTYYCDNECLYFKTDIEFRKADITVITQGRLFKNKDSLENRGIVYMVTEQKRYLSDLTNNEVERISIDLLVIFGAKRTREKLPTVDYMKKRFIRA